MEPAYPSTLSFQSRRSPLLCRHGAVCSSQMMASQVGVDILKANGNAMDACIAMAAVLNVTEPCSTGLGGDCFAIYFDAKTKKVHGLNGSGRSPRGLSLESLPDSSRRPGHPDELDPLSVHAITIPGAAAGWCDATDRFGSKPLSELLNPAIELAEEGFAVEPITAHSWKASENLLKRHKNGSQLLNKDGKAPTAGDVFTNPTLARTMRILGEKGKAGFYEGEIADSIIEILQEHGGFHTSQDLKDHISTYPEPISVNYHGVDVWEIPPSGQGLTALLALNVISHLPKPLSDFEHSSADRLHILIEAMRIAFADTRTYIADPDVEHVPIKWLLSKEYALARAKLINMKSATIDTKHGTPIVGSDTVSFCAVDSKGNACSFINSNYQGFGSGLVPKNCGFTLQNRGANFSLVKGHANSLAPFKRPYHTIIPGLCTVNGELLCPFSNMGGFAQPQGHVQLITNLVDYALEPQTAIDMPRFCIESGTAGGYVCLEDSVASDIIEELVKRGHDIRVVKSWQRSVVGRAQIILRTANNVLWAGSDGRGDGQACGY